MSLKIRAHARRRILQFTVFGITMAGLTGLAAFTQPLFAQDPDSYPGIENTANSLWRLTNKSPDDNLMWLYANNTIETGQYEHLVKNEYSSNVRYTKIKAYFVDKPTSVTVNVQRAGVCSMSQTDASSRLTMTVGGVPVYDQSAFGERKYGNDARDFERRVLLYTGEGSPVNGPNDGTTDTWAADPGWPTSRVCGDLPADTYQYIEQKYQCIKRDKDGKCTDRGYETELSETRTRLNAATGVDFRGAMPPANNPYSKKADGSRLWEVEIVVHLTGTRYTSQTAGEALNQIRYDLKVPGAKYVGFAETEASDSGERQFGVAAGLADQSSKYGVKLAVPFGMACSDKAQTRTADLALYDVDMQGFGRVYAVVFERNQETGEVTRLSKNNADYFSKDKFQPAGPYDWLGSVNAFNRDTSRFSITMKRGFSYMLVVNNPNQIGQVIDYNGTPKTISLSPIGNVFSLRVPTDSLPGVTNCNYTLTPSVDPIAPTFSYDASFSVTGRISVTGEDFQSHKWRLCAMRFASVPDISPAINTNTPQEQQPGCETIAASNQVDGFGTNFADGPYARTVTDVPLGQTVCYMMSVEKPTFKADDNVWSHSQLQCSQSVVTPKVQVHGDDLKSTGLINTSLGRVGNQVYGSWSEYATLSNGANLHMGSGNGLLGGVPDGTAQPIWKPLTFASGTSQFGGIYGNFGGVTVPVPLVNRDGETDIGAPASLGSLGGLDRHKVYRIPGTLRITNNLNYSDFGAFNNVDELPRVVLVANDIIIDPDVTNIDPWLVAIGTSTTPGRVSTCSTVPGWSMQYAALYGAQSGVGGICTKQLKFNGPVMASKVFLYRTYDTRGGDPAEIFNLRADAYLSALSNGPGRKPVATTDFVTELPPRF